MNSQDLLSQELFAQNTYLDIFSQTFEEQQSTDIFYPSNYQQNTDHVNKITKNISKAKQQLNVSTNKKTKFSQQDDKIILQMVKQNGKKWREIAQKLSGQNETMIRNRYYAKLRHNSENDSDSASETRASTNNVVTPNQNDAQDIFFNTNFEEFQNNFEIEENNQKNGLFDEPALQEYYDGNHEMDMFKDIVPKEKNFDIIESEQFNLMPYDDATQMFQISNFHYDVENQNEESQQQEQMLQLKNQIGQIEGILGDCKNEIMRELMQILSNKNNANKENEQNN